MHLLFERSWDENRYVCPFKRVSRKASKWIKNFKSLYSFGGRFLKIRDVCMDFEPYFKVHNLVSVYLKSIILGQMTNLNMIFHVVVSVYRLVKIWNSPQFPAERNGQCIKDLSRDVCAKNMSEEKTTTRQGLVCAKTRAGQKTPKICVSR